MTVDELKKSLMDLDPEGKVFEAVNAVTLNSTLPDGIHRVKVMAVDLGRWGRGNELCIRVTLAREGWSRTLFYSLENTATIRAVKTELYRFAEMSADATIEAVVQQIGWFAEQGMTVEIELRTERTSQGTFQNVRFRRRD